MRDTREDVTVELTNAAHTQFQVLPTGESDAEGNPCVASLIFDGDARGMWTANAVVELARECGWTGKDSQEDIDAHQQSRIADGPMLLSDTADGAESYLNEIVPDGYSFGFDDGSFYLANEAWWCVAGGE